MQWTDDSGVAYGEDPNGAAGYAYPCDHAYPCGHAYYYDGATTTTATTSWDPVQAVQWTQPTGDAYGTATDLYATGTQVHSAGPPLPTAVWDGPHGDVLTVPTPELDPLGPSVPGTDTPQGEAVRPVFVDASGRRQRRVLRAARLLVIPAGGYVALLISAVLGGPSLSAPFVPQPDSPHAATPHASAPDADSSAGRPDATSEQKNSHPTAVPTTLGTTGPPTPSATSAAAPAPAPTATPTGIASPTSDPTVAPDPSTKGRALGTSHKPVK